MVNQCSTADKRVVIVCYAFLGRRSAQSAAREPRRQEVEDVLDGDSSHAVDVRPRVSREPSREEVKDVLHGLRAGAVEIAQAVGTDGPGGEVGRGVGACDSERTA